MRVGQVLRLRPEWRDAYVRHHARIWPEVAAAIRAAGIRNYSIFHRDGWLFAVYEFDGTREELDKRMDALARAPRMREWWDLMEPMQEPIPSAREGEWWAAMEEVFHLD